MPQIRRYQDADWPRLCEIHDAARLDELRLSVGVEAFLSLEQTAESEGLFAGEVWVSEADGRVDGFVAFAEDELTWLYVHPDAARRGLGAQLLRVAIERSGAVLRTEVLEGNAPALALYLREGFRIEKTVSGRLTGNDAFAATGHILLRER